MLWDLVKEIDDLLEYFPDMKENELPERDYLWWVISTLKYDETKKLVDDARKSRSYEGHTNNDDFIEVDNEIFKEINTIYWQKGKLCSSLS